MGRIKEYFTETVPKIMVENPEKLTSIDGVFQFNFFGEEEGKYVLDCKEGKAYEGEHDEPDCTLEMSDEDFYAILDKQLNPMMAFSMGKLKVSGNLPLSLKLQDIF